MSLLVLGAVCVTAGLRWPAVYVFVYAAIPGMLYKRDDLAPRRRRNGLCACCGYDLTGNVSGGVCPECGRGVGRGNPERSF